MGLRIDRAGPADAGVYGVTITNPLGEESSEGKATVRKVFQPPAFTQRFTDLQQVSRVNFIISCSTIIVSDAEQGCQVSV